MSLQLKLLLSFALLGTIIAIASIIIHYRVTNLITEILAEPTNEIDLNVIT